MSDDFLTLLRERLSGLLVERSKIDEAKLSLDEKFENLMADARRDGRSDLNADEVAALEAMKAERKALDDRRAQLEKDITEAEQREADIVRTRRDAAEAADKIKRFNIAPLSTSKNGVRGSDHTLDELLWAGADSVRAGRLTTDTADFIANHHLTYPSIYDYSGQVMATWHAPISVVPTTLVIDRQHRAAAVFLRAVTTIDLLPVLDRLVAESTASTASTAAGAVSSPSGVPR